MSSAERLAAQIVAICTLFVAVTCLALAVRTAVQDCPNSAHRDARGFCVSPVQVATP